MMNLQYSSEPIPPHVLDEIKARGIEVYGQHLELAKSGGNSVARCCFHDERTPSFTVFPDGGFKCFGCGKSGDVLAFVMEREGVDFPEAARRCAAALGLRLDEPHGRGARIAAPTARQSLVVHEGGANAAMKPQIVATYDYRGEDGELVFQAVRFEPGKNGKKKGFQQRRPDGNGGWAWNLKGVERMPLYGLPEWKDAPLIFVVEGEKDVHTLEGLGFNATTAAGGSSAPWRAEYTEMLRDKSVVLIPDNDEPGRTHREKVRKALQGVVRELIIVDLPDGSKDITEWVEAGGTKKELIGLVAEARAAGVKPLAAPGATTGSEPGILVRKVSSIKAKKIDWLWRNRIARGKLTMIAGNPGLGKSQVTLDLAARVTRGNKWPDGEDCPAGDVVILSAEDDAADTIRPRLEAAGADIERVHVIEAAIEGYTGDGAQVVRAFSLRRDIEHLRKALDSVGNAALVIIDPITAYLDGADSHKNAEVRALLSPLSAMADAARVAVVFVSHLNKTGSTDALARVSASIAFVAAVRAGYLVGKDPEDDRRRLFLPMKNNVGDDVTGLAFHVEAATVASGEGDIDTSRVAWQSGTVTTRAHEILEPERGDAGDRSALDEAVVFLEDMLGDGPQSPHKIGEAGKRSGHSWATIKRAKGKLGVVAKKTGLDGGWEWSLPE